MQSVVGRFTVDLSCVDEHTYSRYYSIASSSGHSRFLMLFLACNIRNWEWPGDEANYSIGMKLQLTRD